jgi:quinol monooxygenase YgiN
MADLETNVEPFTPEVLARRMIEQYGDQAAFQAAMNADHFFENNQNHIAKIWQEASKIIAAVQAIMRAAGKD